MAGKLEKKLGELEFLKSKKMEMDARVAFLEEELATAVANREDLEVAAKALDAKKAEASKLRSKIVAHETCNGKMDCEIQELKVALEEKKGERQQEQEKKTQTMNARLTIFYGESICVYDSVTQEMAQAIMVIVAATAASTKNNTTSAGKPPVVPATNTAQAAVPSEHHSDSRWILDSVGNIP